MSTFAETWNHFFPQRSVQPRTHNGEIEQVVRVVRMPEIKQIDDNRIHVICSNEQEDRFGDSISSDGWDLRAYQANPVILWSHDHKIPAIGKAINMHVDRQKKSLVSDIEFAQTEFAQQIASLYRQKVLRAVSVGFRALQKPEPRTDENGMFTGYTFLKQELIELSCCNVGALDSALVQNIYSTLGSEEAVCKFFGATYSIDSREQPKPTKLSDAQKLEHALQLISAGDEETAVAIIDEVEAAAEARRAGQPISTLTELETLLTRP